MFFQHDTAYRPRGLQSFFLSQKLDKNKIWVKKIKIKTHHKKVNVVGNPDFDGFSRVVISAVHHKHEILFEFHLVRKKLAGCFVVVHCHLNPFLEPHLR